MSGVPEAAAVMTSRDLFTVGPRLYGSGVFTVSAGSTNARAVHHDGAYRPVGSPQPYQSISGGGPVMKHGMNLNSGDKAEEGEGQEVWARWQHGYDNGFCPAANKCGYSADAEFFSFGCGYSNGIAAASGWIGVAHCQEGQGQTSWFKQQEKANGSYW
ncbi:UNVERIFIED_CONTAM: hypothetical protein Sradi_3541900 [Sesamum radiatum]|uniref:Uncharacterized protein n=1 Tax=Sesamum radiatum TaxID=300843 RepID=A0AAW2QGY3_SESRA